MTNQVQNIFQPGLDIAMPDVFNSFFGDDGESTAPADGSQRDEFDRAGRPILASFRGKARALRTHVCVLTSVHARY